jgi:acyl dehydratase
MDLTPGAEIPPFSRKADFDAWNRYAAVNDEFVPIHMDDAAGQEAGFASAIGMGNLGFSYLHNALRAWLGEAGRIEKISVSYRQPVLRKTVVTAHGQITGVERTDQGAQVELRLWLDDDGGRTLLDGAATVRTAA